MAKTATLKSKDVLGKDFTIIDSMSNVKKINAGMKAIYKRVDEVDSKDGNATFADFNEVITDEVVKQVAKLLNLDKEDQKKLENMSYDDLFTFYSSAVNNFTGMETPSVRAMKKRQEEAVKALSNEDPKSSSEN